MAKKIIVAFLMAFMVVALVGCGAQEKMEEKIAESVTEGVINKALDGEGKVNIDGDKITVEGQDGEEFTFGEVDWPGDGAAQQIPQPNKGKVVSAMNAEEFCLITLEEVEAGVFENYLEDIKGEGFTNDSVEFTSDSSYTYSASKDENNKISLMYDSEAQSLTITYEISE